MIEKKPAGNGDATDAISKIDKALAHVHDLCQGKEKWTMRVPADATRDSDLLICDALESAKRLLSAVTTCDRNAVLDEAMKVCAELDVFFDNAIADTGDQRLLEGKREGAKRCAEAIAALKSTVSPQTNPERDADHFFRLSGKYLEELNRLEGALGDLARVAEQHIKPGVDGYAHLKFAQELLSPQTGGERPCATCNDDPAVCATVPGLRHCEAAMRERNLPCTDAKEQEEGCFRAVRAERLLAEAQARLSSCATARREPIEFACEKFVRCDKWCGKPGSCSPRFAEERPAASPSSNPQEAVAEAKARLRRAIKLFHNADEYWGTEMVADFEPGAPKDMTLLDWIDDGIERCVSAIAKPPAETGTGK